MKPRIFISAVSSELKSARQLAVNKLLRLGYDPVVQEIFGTEQGDLTQMLRDKIDDCDGLIQLVGRGYGVEPPAPDADFGRVSYTQFEFLYALKQKGNKQTKLKETWLIFVEDGCTRDLPPENLDLPSDPSHTNPSAYQAERQLLQDAWRDRRREERAWQWTMKWTLAAVAAMVVWLVLSVGTVLWQQKAAREQFARLQQLADNEVAQRAADKKLQQQFAERFLENLVRDKNVPVEVARKQALAELPVLTGLSSEAIQKIIDGRIADLANDIGATPLDRARAALTIADYDGVLTEAAKNRTESRELELLAGAAALAKFREQPLPKWNEQALAAFERALALSDGKTQQLEWADAAIWVGFVQDELGRFPDAVPIVRNALRLREIKLGPNDPAVATALNNLALLLQPMNRWEEAESLMRRALDIDEQSFGAEHPNVARDLNNLATLLHDTNRLVETEVLLRRALTIIGAAYGSEHPRFATQCNNLAKLLQVTNRGAEAEPLYRRALLILEHSYGPEQPEVATCLNNLATLLHDTNRFAEAEPLLRRALAIDEHAYRTEHPDVARDLNDLALLLKETNRLTEAEALARRALAIDEQSYESQHPLIARDLNNLAQLLAGTHRLPEAELLLRRALAIHEQTRGPMHRNVAACLNDLGTLLQRTNRLDEAAPLLRRAATIWEQSLGPDHPDLAIGLINLAGLLHATNRLAEAEPLFHRGLVILEQSYGAEHFQVAIGLHNLANLLKDTNRLEQAETLMRRALTILARSFGAEHPSTITVRKNYSVLLASLEPARDDVDVEEKVKGAMEKEGPLTPIAPEVERLLGPVKPVDETLAALDRQYQLEGKPAVYFLPPDQPIAPHLEELLKPNADFLTMMGVAAYRNATYAEAIVLYEEALKLNEAIGGNSQEVFTTRMNRAAALRELGEVKQGREELRQLLPEVGEDIETPAFLQGRSRYHLALCDWRLGDNDAAKHEAEESLKAYEKEFNEIASLAAMKGQTRQLLSNLEENKSPPPLPNVDSAAELNVARARFQARQTLATLPVDQPVGPYLKNLLGPAKSTQEVLDALDRQYREQGKPAVWFLPLSEPISPYLDELLGRLPEVTNERNAENAKDAE